ncbi:MAG: hypothetical protein RJQ09_21260 [Cyclobacteriaceae bacterium]
MNEFLYLILLRLPFLSGGIICLWVAYLFYRAVNGQLRLRLIWFFLALGIHFVALTFIVTPDYSIEDLIRFITVPAVNIAIVRLGLIMLNVKEL